MNSCIKVGIVEDQFLFREGLKAILAGWERIEIVFESEDGFSVISRLEQSGTIPDVMLVDLSLPAYNKKDFNGLHVTGELLKHYPGIKIVILSVHNDENFIAQLIENGAHAYLVKDTSPDEVYDAIVSVYEKGVYINKMTLLALQKRSDRRPGQKVKQLALQISRREQEILQLICQQYTTEEIAKKLFISVKTVNGHRNNLLAKTGSRNAAGLVMFAIKNEIVTIV